ncbi:MAG: FAD-dependent oxidoreductase [Verrucomicrobia bacterium]|nr:FAD-dependent oxidoreductase [Verrucomicrobiota bacterium]
MKPVLVVGHGLAGAILAQSLLMRGIRVHCVDAGIKHSASSVAAGLINPFIGPKLNIPEQFNECMKANLAFFQNWEIEAGEKLFHSEHLLRVFTTEKQVSRWRELSESSDYAMFKEINHFSGIRSGTKDRNPILGKHPEHKNLFIFNGFGSRGSTTIMFNANRLINFLEMEIELPEKVSLKRFMGYYKGI